ncbi:hypothetical protein [Halorientalis persicus]|nr:hypothetical protein [Halorientalis persicus]
MSGNRERRSNLSGSRPAALSVIVSTRQRHAVAARHGRWGNPE